MQWSSVVISSQGADVAFVDVEQANALELLLLRHFWLERPIFSHLEFMIRAAEALYDDGDLPLAAAMTERANQRLREYCAHLQSGEFIPRPKRLDPLLEKILEGRILLSFIAGHELGHLLQQKGAAGVGPLFDWIALQFEDLHLDRPPTGPARERFLLPELVQKFDDAGQPAGFATRAMKMVNRFKQMRERLVKEVQADSLGLIAASQAAIEIGVPCNILFAVLMSALEHTEMLMMLRRLLPRLPRGVKAASIAHEGTNLFARQLIFLRLVRGIRNGEVSVPEPVKAYWLASNAEELAKFEEMAVAGRLEQIGLRAAVVARGGIEVGLHGTLDPHVSAEDRVKQYGPLLPGGLIVAEAHRGYPEELYRVESKFDWTPEDTTDTVLCGFASALRDISELTSTETRPANHFSRPTILLEDSDAAFVEFLRSARTQVVRMKINPCWTADFEAVLRNYV